jgi:hypothetical protein
MADEYGPRLEEELRALGRSLTYPRTPELASAVRASLEAPGPDGTRQPWRSGWGLLAPLALAIVLVLSAAFGFAYALRGLVIRPVESLPPVASLTASPLPIGTHTTLADAAAELSFTPLVPSLPALGEPDGIFIDETGDIRQLVMTWRPDARTGAPQLLLAQFVADVDGGFLLKEVPTGTAELLEVSVSGGRGYWIDGGPHTLTYVSSARGPLHDRTRLVGNVLVWEREPLTLRLETEGGLDEALAVAESVRPADP